MGTDEGLPGFVLGDVGKDATADVGAETLLATFQDDNAYLALCLQFIFYCIMKNLLGVV